MQPLWVETGTLLAAWPDMLDPNFMHTVVLACQHDGEGAYGLVLNRPTPHMVRDLLPEHPLLGRCELPVHSGGPVDASALQFVHRVQDRVPGGLPLSGALVLGGDLDALGRYLIEEPEAALENVRFYLGYSGWGAGQLEGELITGSWLPAACDAAAVFGADEAETWRRVVRSAGPGTGLENLPPDASWN